jgi:hypothetical protein
VSYAISVLRGPAPSASELSRASSRPVAGLTTTDSHAIENPLWIIVIGMACFFGTAALLIAWG